MAAEPPATLIEVSAVRRGLQAAFARLLAAYVEVGGHRFHGWTEYDEPRNYYGPLIWSEADAVFRYALELEREFPRQVHCEFKVNRNTRLDFPDGDEKTQKVDIGISDLDGFAGDDTAHNRFREHQHLALIEAKWFAKGYRGLRWEYDAHNRVKAVQDDLDKLARHLRLGRCLVAAMLVVDDEDFFHEHTEQVTWPQGVERLVCGPAELRRRGMLE